MKAEFVDQNDVVAVLFPPDIDPNQRSQFSSAQSNLSKDFLVENGGTDKCKIIAVKQELY